MIQIKDKKDCCGCNACGDICPKKAISFKVDHEGFGYPEVDKRTCIDCGLCEKVCPEMHSEELKKNDFEIPKCYAAQCKNLESLFNSTSGSAFATFAERIYKIGGYVGGAVFNEDYSVTQFISSNKSDLERLRNSKYVQSNSEGFFLAVRDLLNGGNNVLVCGIPCQMAALRSFLGKEYDNLLIVDLICLGINSPKILRKYLDSLEKKHRSKIVYYKAKNKELGWRKLTTKVVFESGEVEYDKRETNPFTYGFIATHAFSRPSCYSCKFKGTPRIADISIGDLWGAENIVGTEYDRDLGTSVILINSHKGQKFYQSVKSGFKEKEITYEEVLKGNPALTNAITMPVFDRKVFYEDLEKLPFEVFVHKYIHLPINKSLSFKQKIKNIVRFIFLLMRTCCFSLPTWWKNIKYNLLQKNIRTSIMKGQFLLIHKHCVIDISKQADVIIEGILQFGYKRVSGSRLESRLLIERDATFFSKGGLIFYGADIEVFKKSTLSLGKDIVFNMQSTIICGCNIQIADNVCFGRNVTVRDNNGGHYISRKIYKDKRPVCIGQHSWICEQAIVMPGSKLGVGVIVGARSMVSGKLPNFTLASGTPAEVVDEEIYWKA